MTRMLLAAIASALLVAHVPHRCLVAAGERPRSLPAPKDDLGQERALRSLARPTEVNFIEAPLSDGLQYLSEYNSVPIHLDADSLQSAKISTDSPVDLKRNQDSFQRILNLMTVPVGLDWYVEGQAIVVTTRTAAAEAFKARLEAQLNSEMQLVDFICELTDAQREKLQIASKGNFLKLRERIDTQTAIALSSPTDEKRLAEAFDELEQAQSELLSNPFGNGSFFRKSLEAGLTPEQTPKYAPIRAVLQAGGMVGTLQDGDDTLLAVVMIGPDFSDDQLAALESLTPLGSLRMDASKVSDKGLRHLKGLKNLRELSIGVTVRNQRSIALLLGTRVTDAGLAELSDLKELRRLNLYGQRVTNAGLKHIKNLPALRELNVKETAVTGEGVAELKKARPELQINK